VSRRAGQVALGTGLAALVGWALWAAGADDADPYDGGPFWTLGLVTAVAAGLVADMFAASVLIGAALVAYPTYWTFTETHDSPFGPLGVIFLWPWGVVAGCAAVIGVVVRRQIRARTTPSQ
jgi:hypothetical protein